MDTKEQLLSFNALETVKKLEIKAQEHIKKSPDQLKKEKEKEELFLKQQQETINFLCDIEDAIEENSKSIINVTIDVHDNVFRTVIESEWIMKFIQLEVDCPCCQRQTEEYFGRKIYPRLCRYCFPREANANRVEWR